MVAKNTFLEATILRRSTVDLKKESSIPDSRVIEIAKHALLHGPSAFHVQSVRAVVLLNQHHDRLWDMIYDHTKQSMPPPVFEGKLGPKLKSHRDSYGTIIFFEDPTAVDNMPQFQQPLFKAFPEWAEHANGMAQYIAWTALCAEGLGANLQHCHKGLEARWAEEWNLPKHWIPRAQVVFGTPAGPPRGGHEKEFAPIEPRLKVFEH